MTSDGYIFPIQPFKAESERLMYLRAADEYLSQAIDFFSRGFYGDAVVAMNNADKARAKATVEEVIEDTRQAARE